MRFYGASDILRENQLLQTSVELTLTGICTITRRTKTVTDGVPSEAYVDIAVDVPCAIAHWEERPGRDEGVTILAGNRFIGHFLTAQVIKVGDRIEHASVVYQVDAVNTPVTIQVAQQVHLTLVA